MRRKKKEVGTIRVVVFAPGEEPKLCSVRNELQSLQAIVDGYLETVGLNNETILVCDEEGLLKGKMLQRVPGIGVYAGTMFVCGIDEDELTDVPEDFMRAYIR